MRSLPLYLVMGGIAMICRMVAGSTGDTLLLDSDGIPVLQRTEVVVVGGSTAGVAAAVAAAQNGADVVLGAARPYLGEDMTASYRLWLHPGEESRHPLAKAIYAPALAPEPELLRFTYTVSPGYLSEAAELARRNDALLNIHAAETAGEVAMVAEAHGLPPVELLGELGVLEGDVLVAHGVHLSPREVELLARWGTSVAHCPASNLKLASGVAPVMELLDAGVNVCLGTDGAASSNDLDLLWSVRLAALIHKTIGVGGADATNLPAPLALSMATVRGARAVGLGDRLGVLRAGMLADMVAIDLDTPFTQPVHDPCSAVVYAAGRESVTDVWSEGVRVVRDGRHQLVDEAEVVRDLEELGASIR